MKGIDYTIPYYRKNRSTESQLKAHRMSLNRATRYSLMPISRVNFILLLLILFCLKSIEEHKAFYLHGLMDFICVAHFVVSWLTFQEFHKIVTEIVYFVELLKKILFWILAERSSWGKFEDEFEWEDSKMRCWKQSLKRDQQSFHETTLFRAWVLHLFLIFMRTSPEIKIMKCG